MVVASLVAERGPQDKWAPAAAAHGLRDRGSRALAPRLGGCAAWAWSLCGIWGLLGSGIEPVSPALAGGFFTTEPPGKPWKQDLEERFAHP